jgi:tetratricopeptide (TPR) repeat protein
MKTHFIFFLLCIFTFVVSAQNRDTAAINETMSHLMNYQRNKIQFSKISMINKTCNCVDSILGQNISQVQQSNGIDFCILSTALTFNALDYMSLNYQINNQEIRFKKRDTAFIINSNYKFERILLDSCTQFQVAFMKKQLHDSASITSDSIVRTNYTTGIELMSIGSFKDAIYKFEEVVQSEKMFLEAWNNMGICHIYLGNFEQALATFNESLKYNHPNLNLLNGMALVYEYQNNTKKAIKIYTECIRKYPEAPKSFYRLGCILFNKGNYSEGVDFMCKAYNKYLKTNSPYLLDTEMKLNDFYYKMLEVDKTKLFETILSKNEILIK